MLTRVFLFVFLSYLLVAGCGGDVGNKGACCLPDGTCEQTGYDECNELGGGFKGVPSSCDADPCVSTCGSDSDCGIGMYCHSSGECREGCKTDPDSCAEGECDPADHTCKEPAYCSELRSRIQAYVDWKINNDITKYAGLIVGVDTPDCGKSVHATGLAVLDPETPMRPEHGLPIASVSKTFVAATILQLVGEGRLSLDDTLSKWRTDVINAESITIRHLLNHTSGVADHRGGFCMTEYLNSYQDWTTEELVDCIDGETPYCDPGTGFYYSNTNYVLLGLVVEAVTGNPLHEEIRNRLLDPLGLESTFMLWYEDARGELSHSYVPQNDGTWLDTTDKYNFSFNYGCGNIASNASDLLVWIRELLLGSALTEAMRTEMMTLFEVDPASEAEYYYGLGIQCVPSGNAGQICGHAGQIETSVSVVAHSRKLDSSAVVLSNRRYINYFNDWPVPIIHDLFEILVEYK